MPHKAKHKTSQRKEKNIQTPAAAPASSGTHGAMAEGAPQIKASVPQSKAAAGYRPGMPRTGSMANTAAVGPARYPFLSNEMKWIGIFALVIIVVLVILSFILPRFLT